MTFASKITITRMLLVPVFAVLTVLYSQSVLAGAAQENLRWSALTVFIVASASDALDGWVARRFNQKSKFGAFIDPFADKLLLLTGIVFLSAFPWGDRNWRIPPWFMGLVIARDVIIIVGIVIIRRYARIVHYQPHWTGKMSTVTQMFALGWVMLKIQVLPPVYACTLAAVFTAWSGVTYIIEGARQLQQNPKTLPATLP